MSDMSDDDKRSALILIMEDLRGAFFPVNPRTRRVIELATDLGYTQVVEHAAVVVKVGLRRRSPSSGLASRLADVDESS